MVVLDLNTQKKKVAKMSQQNVHVIFVQIHF